METLGILQVNRVKALIGANLTRKAYEAANLEFKEIGRALVNNFAPVKTIGDKHRCPLPRI